MILRYLCILLLVTPVAYGQQWQNRHVGFQLKLIASIGTHQTSIGVRADGYVNLDYAQVNLGTALRFHVYSFGGRINFPEWRHQAGIVLMAGKENNPVNFVFDGALHQSARPYSLGLSHLWYVDNQGTSQRSGMMNLGIQRVDVQFENDIFAGQGRDKFRTGDCQVSYRDEFNRVAVGVRLWTGETRGSAWNKEPAPGMPGGYRDLSPLPYGKTSSGLFFISGQKVFAAHQYTGMELGFDSEQIRYVFQNKLSHDLVLLPKKVKRHTPHYPRLGEEGLPVFSRSEMRKTLPLLRFYVNDITTY